MVLLPAGNIYLHVQACQTYLPYINICNNKGFKQNAKLFITFNITLAIHHCLHEATVLPIDLFLYNHIDSQIYLIYIWVPEKVCK